MRMTHGNDAHGTCGSVTVGMHIMRLTHDEVRVGRDAHEQLKHIDLNLLVPLAVLLEEQHVTRAATRLGMSQAGMSRALGRLRETFDDPLLVRTPGGMCRSAAADSMMGPLRELLRSARSLVFEHRGFDPGASTRTFSLVFDGYFMELVLPRMLARIRTEAPGISFRLVPRGPGVHERLASGHLDLLADLGGMDLAGLRQQRIIDERVVVIAPIGHPLLDAPFDVHTFARYPSVLWEAWLQSLVAVADANKLLEQRLSNFVSASS